VCASAGEEWRNETVEMSHIYARWRRADPALCFALLGYCFSRSSFYFWALSRCVCSLRALLIFIITKLTPFLCLLERARPKSVKGIKVALCYVVLCVFARARALFSR
jgi:hypothetical protein